MSAWNEVSAEGNRSPSLAETRQSRRPAAIAGIARTEGGRLFRGLTRSHLAEAPAVDLFAIEPIIRTHLEAGQFVSLQHPVDG